MIAPFFKYGLFGFDVSLIVAFVIGIGFGFALERGGFGNARILAAQFYFTNMRVLKVMFTAILTAMLGVYFLSVLGFVDLSLVYIGDTYLYPQIIGGFILGLGFVVGGYCPGTSVVSMATGRKDGVLFILGVAFGILVFGELYPYLSDFASSSPMGRYTLPDLFGISYGLVVFLVVLMALGAFLAAEWGEKVMAKKTGEAVND